MKTEKKNQHYVPQFYLRYFSIQNNKKEIGVFNIDNSIYIKRSSIKGQASKNYFYGEDGVIEDKLSLKEGLYAAVIKSLLFTNKFPDFPNPEYAILMEFVLISQLRNPIFIHGIKEAQEFINEGYKTFPLEESKERHKSVIRDLFSQVSMLGLSCADLKHKLLVNNTKTPFIVSDNPILAYNQFLESKKWKFGKTAIGCTGIQIFIPLTPNLCLLLFDGDIYNLGDQNELQLTLPTDIDQINLLQFLNCSSNVFFNHQIKENYLVRLSKKMEYYPKPHLPIREVYPGQNDDEGYSEYRMAGRTDLEINLHLSFIKYSNYSLRHKPSASIVDIRPHVQRVRQMAREGKFDFNKE